MFETRLVNVKRDHQGKDRLAVLDRDHAPRGEALAIADAVDFVDDRHLGIAADQEIAVQRVRRAAVHRAAGRGPRPADHPPPPNPPPAIPWAYAPEKN